MTDFCAPNGPRIYLNHRHRARMLDDQVCQWSGRDDLNSHRREEQAVEEPYAHDMSCYVLNHGGCMDYVVVSEDHNDATVTPYTAKCTLIRGHDGFHYGQEVATGDSASKHGHIWLSIGVPEPERDNGFLDGLKNTRWCVDPSHWRVSVEDTCLGARESDYERSMWGWKHRCEPQGKWIGRDRTNPYNATRDCYVIDPGHCLAWTWDSIHVEDGYGLGLLECRYQRGHGLHHDDGCAGWTERVEDEKVGDPRWSSDEGEGYRCDWMSAKNCRVSS